MVVEDEALVAKDIQNTLARLGYSVPAVCSSGEDAIRRAAEVKPDLVLMDIMLQGEMDGVAAAQVMRDKYNLPVVYLTAYADDGSVDRARLTEPFGYLLKPFNQKELRSAIEVALYKHQMEQNLRERERWFSTTLRSIADAVIAVDAQGRVTFMNTVAERLTQWNMQDAVGRMLSDVYKLVPAEAATPAEESARLRRPVHSVLVGREGLRAPVEETVSPIQDAEGEVLGMVRVFRDISERQKMEDSLANADRLTSLGTLAAGVAHEINNPLTFVVGNVGFAADELGEILNDLRNQERGEPVPAAAPGQLLERLDTVLVALQEASRGSERVRVIVDDLRVFARSESRSQRVVDLHEVLDFALKMSSHQLKHRATLVKEMGPTPRVKANETSLTQVFMNLLVNAAQAIPEGQAQHNSIKVVTRTGPDNRAVVEIHDSGSGIPPEMRRRIFDPFFTTKPVGVGTGLGLAISLRTVTGMGGDLSVTSEVGKGSVFTVTLPGITEQAPVAAPVEKREAPRQGNRARVLVVDDEEMVGTTIRRTLMTEHEVEVVTSAVEALKKLTNGERYDVILCDLMMPEMTGMDLYDELVQASPEQAARMLFLSGGAFTERAQAMIEMFPRRCLKKPFEPKNLRGLVRDFLKEQKDKDAAAPSA